MEYRPNPQQIEKLKIARKTAWDVLFEAAEQVRPGFSEQQIRDLVKDSCRKRGIVKDWHSPKIRIGTDTTKSFSNPSDPSLRLQESDLFFLDLGPVVDGFEADVGETFVLGENREFLKLKKITREIFDVVAEKFEATKMTGEELYRFAEEESLKRGYPLESKKAGGHLLAEFPHHVHHRGALRIFPDKIVHGAWVLEIQLSTPDGKFGSFYEDLLF